MALFTVVLDYAGGTYIEQVRSASAAGAAKRWARDLVEEQIKGLGSAGKAELCDQLGDDSPVALTGLTNAWCQTASVNGKLALINLIKTA